MPGFQAVAWWASAMAASSVSSSRSSSLIQAAPTRRASARSMRRTDGLEVRIGSLEGRMARLEDAIRSATNRFTTLLVGQTVAMISVIGLVAA